MKMPHLFLITLLLLGLYSCNRITEEDYAPIPEAIVVPTGLKKSWNVPLVLASDQMASLESIKTNDHLVVTVHIVIEKETYKRLFYQVAIHDKWNGSLQFKIIMPYIEHSKYFSSLHAFGDGCLYESSDSFYCINTRLGKITRVFSAKEFGVNYFSGLVYGKKGMYLYSNGSSESLLIHCNPEKGIADAYRSGATRMKHFLEFGPIVLEKILW